MPILRPQAARFDERRLSSVTLTSAHLYDNVYMRVSMARALSTTGPPCSVAVKAACDHRLACAGEAACSPAVECYRRRRQTPATVT